MMIAQTAYVAENLQNVEGSVDDLIEGLCGNSRLPEGELDGVIADIEQAPDDE